MGFIENLLAKLGEGEEGPGIILPPLPWEVGASSGEMVPVLTRTSVREQEGVTIKETLSQVMIGKVGEGSKIEPPAIAQAQGVQHAQGGTVVYEASSAFSRVEGYGSSAQGSAGAPAIKKRRRA